MNHNFCLVSTGPHEMLVYCACGWVGNSWNDRAERTKIADQWRLHYRDVLQISVDVRTAHDATEAVRAAGVMGSNV